jgi:hypothetical protein
MLQIFVKGNIDDDGILEGTLFLHSDLLNRFDCLLLRGSLFGHVFCLLLSIDLLWRCGVHFVHKVFNSSLVVQNIVTWNFRTLFYFLLYPDHDFRFQTLLNGHF